MAMCTCMRASYVLWQPFIGTLIFSSSIFFSFTRMVMLSICTGHAYNMDASHRLRCLLFDRRFYTWVGCKFQFHTLKTTQSCLGYLGYWCCIKFPNFCPELWWSAQQQQKKSLTHMSFMLNSDHYNVLPFTCFHSFLLFKIRLLWLCRNKNT